MSETSKWDDYFVRVGRYLESRDIESEELDYKRETAQELARYRDELLAQQTPITIKPIKDLSQLGGWRKFPDVLKWLSTERGADALRELWARYDGQRATRVPPVDVLKWLSTERGADALRELWARYDGQRATRVPPVDDVIERVRRFSIRLPKEILQGSGTRMRPISVLLMALDAEQYPVFMTTAFDSAYAFLGFEKTRKDADEAGLYTHAITFLDRFITEAKRRGRDTPSNRLEAQSLVWALHQGRDAPASPPEGTNGTDNENEGHDPNPASSLTVLAARLLLPVEFLRNIKTLLSDKRQVIFQGPPGTGKTYVARALAACLAGADERVQLVQFHPSYAYEDFVQGFRPALRDGQPGFELRNGPLVDAAKRAKAEPEAKHFLVIDEINRGNLAKVFGELYFLLEYRDADLRLLYSDEPFSLPNNLYVIGTMNTADRSIALVDLALRRRFHFVEFHPETPPVQGVLRRWLKRDAPEMSWVADLVDRANEKLDERRAAIGPSYFMKRDLDDDMVRLIWEHNVRPYVEEHLYGAHDRLAEFDLDRIRSEIDGGVAGRDDQGEDGNGAPNDAGN